MTQFGYEYLEHQRKRFMRPDAHRFIRPDWRRYASPLSEKDHPFAEYELKYSPDQPRVPAGSSGGGQWTGSGDGRAGDNAETAAADAIFDKAKRIGARGYSSDYLKCLDLCYPVLEIPQAPGVDTNQNNFHKCMAACMGKRR
ncbi:MAG: hypothetical protein Q8M24_24960 [Pseudolabrys sp.]|nr:hypothetical protein [Pseudolabrys sp.]